MLQMLSLDVADMCCWVLQTLNFNVASVEFRCCRHMMLCFVSRRMGGGLLMFDVARNTVATWSQYSRNMVATWEERGGPLIFGCCTQPARNMLVTFVLWL
jgi:hypothetical protein